MYFLFLAVLMCSVGVRLAFQNRIMRGKLARASEEFRKCSRKLHCEVYPNVYL